MIKFLKLLWWKTIVVNSFVFAFFMLAVKDSFGQQNSEPNGIVDGIEIPDHQPVKFIPVSPSISEVLWTKDSTQIALTTNSTINGFSNVIYCSTVELLWKEFINYLGEAPIPLNGNSEIMELNRIASRFNPPIEQEFWFAKVGLQKNGITDSIQKAFKNQFDIDWQPHKNDFDLMGLAYLQKNIIFQHPLDHNVPDIKFKGLTRVECFGLTDGLGGPKDKQIVKIHDYRNSDNFILQIESVDSLDELYFAKIPPEKNVMETYNQVMGRISQQNCVESMHDYDKLIIPYLNFDVRNSFPQFKEVVFTSSKHPGLISEELTQHIQFDLNQNGILLRSTAVLVDILGIADEPPRYYVFDEPFLIILKRKGQSNPYFLYWVENEAHMVRK